MKSSKRKIVLVTMTTVVATMGTLTTAAQGAVNDSVPFYEREHKLSEVVVTVKRPTYVQHIDKKVFNVAQDVMSATVSASELMQNIPSVQVDVDGNVSLRGDENVKILIDGKPSTLMNIRTRADALRQIPAKQIERIEIITNPSAQYKPDGTSGIINIVMKQHNAATEGLNGSLTANAGTAGRANGTASLNYNLGSVGLSASYGIRRDIKRRSETDDRTRFGDATEYLSQRSNTSSKPLSHILRLGADWAITHRDRLQWNGSFNNRSFVKDESITAITSSEQGDIVSNSLRNRRDDEYTRQWETGVTYSHSFRGEGNDLAIGYTFSRQKGLEDNRYEIFSSLGDSKDNSQIWQAYSQHLLNMTVNRKINDRLKFSFGYELDALTTDLNHHVQDWNGQSFVPNMAKTNDFTNRQMSNTLFATMELQLGKWTILAGLRPEVMQIKSLLVNQDSTMRQSYFTIYPSLHTAYTIDEHNEVQLNYSLRVNRPEADDMNPFPEYQNPLTVKAGNPDLKPEKIHSIEAGYQWRGGATTILATLYYRYTTNKITSLTHYTDNTILYKTKENMNGGAATGVELIMNTRLGQWATVNLSGNVFSDIINAERLGYGKDRRATAWNAALNANFNLFRGAALQLNSRYLSSSLIPQGRRDGTFVTDLGAKYDIPRTRLSLSATLSDVFKTFRKSFTIDTPELHQRVVRRFDSRALYIGANWNF